MKSKDAAVYKASFANAGNKFDLFGGYLLTQKFSLAENILLHWLYANENRRYCTTNSITTSFVPKGN